MTDQLSNTLKGRDSMDPKDNFARLTARRANEAVGALRQDMQSFWARLGVVENKTAGIARMGRCGLCGEWTKDRYCRQHSWMEGEE